MTITYPLTPPSTPKARSFRIAPETAVGVHTSPFSFVEQAQRHAGQRWGLSVTLPAMKRAQAEAWIAFLVALNGREGTFLYGDPSGATPQGIATGAPLVDGAGQTGPVLNSKGWTASQTGILKAGDWIQLGSAGTSRLHKILKDADSDAGGLAALDIWPRLRTSPADGATIIAADTVGLFRLSEGPAAWDVDEAQFFGLSFTATEAV